MAPKKSKKDAPTGDDVNSRRQTSKISDGRGSSDIGHESKKRKAQDEAAPSASKASRRSGRGPAAQKVDPIKVINFLLSKNALPFCRPKNEIEDLESRGKQIRTYGEGDFNPFEELICALILSRPISHALGLRSIRTLLNEPYDLSTPKAIKSAGKDGVWNALDAARTQHKGKTAEEIVLFAQKLEEHLGSNENDVNLQKLRSEAGRDAEKEKTALKTHVKGLAKTGIDIFARRIQSRWVEFYPFVDDRAAQALENLGLISNAQGLVDFIGENWEQVYKGNAAGTDDKQKRQLFSQLLERALAAELEGNIDVIKKSASESPVHKGKD